MSSDKLGEESVFDEVDTNIIELLSKDGRMSNRAIGEALSVSPRTIATRINRLQDQDLLKIVALVDMHAAGFDLVLSIGVKTGGRDSRRVGEEISRFDEVISLLLMTGKHNIEMLVLAENHATLARFVKEKLSTVAGVLSVSVAIALQIEKFKFSWAPFVSKVDNGLEICDDERLDSVNQKIVSLLWQDASMPFQEIADKLDSSESNVRSRIMQMKSNNCLRISGVTNMSLHITDMLALVGLGIDGSKREDIIKRLSKIKNVVFISVMLGRFDILTMVVAKSPNRLSEVITGIIESIPGVLNVTTSQRMESIKHDPRWARIP